MYELAPARCVSSISGAAPVIGRPLVGALLGAMLAIPGVATAEQDRSSPTEKGSLVIYPNVEVRWSNIAPYPVIQDTFLHLSNDFPGAVQVKLFFFNGDPPVLVDTAHWNGDIPIEPDAAIEERQSRDPTPDLEVQVYSRAPDGSLTRVTDGEHGIAVSIGFDTLCEIGPINGTMTISYNDLFGDTTEILEAFAVVKATGKDVRLPLEGNLEIVEVGNQSNTTATVGGALPVFIGPPQSTRQGLPGLDQPGEVTFGIVGYEIQPDDPDPLRVHGRFMWADVCDGRTKGCDPAPVETIIVANNSMARLTLDKTVLSPSECDGVNREVTYSYTVTNPGDVPLYVTLTDEPPCEVPVFIGGDVNNNDMIDPENPVDPAEIWTYECTATVAGGISTTAIVTGHAEDLRCTAVAQDDALVGPCDEEERDHPGWNYFDNVITLTANEPAYWSAATGLPKGVSRWQTLDPGGAGQGPGRPDPDDPNQRFIRGYVVAFAIQQAPTGDEIRWNHLSADATIVNYDEGHAWQYGAPAFQVVDAFDHGTATMTPGELFLDGTEYSSHGELLLLNFIASNSGAYSGAGFPVTHDTVLTLMPLFGDFRQDTVGPRTTLATFDIWNENEVKFTNLARCVTCWSSELLSEYPTPNHFLLSALHTSGGKTRIDGVWSTLCAPESARATALIGVAAKLISPGIATGQNLFDLGTQSGSFMYDVHDPPPESRWEEPGDVRRGVGAVGSLNP